MRKLFFRNLTSELTEIELTENGFSLIRPFGAKPKTFIWTDISNVRFSDDNKEVILKRSGEEIVLKNNYIGWYELIQNIPVQYKDFDFVYVQKFMDSLKPCGVCGIISVKENKCIVCETVSWNKEMPESEAVYLKKKQLEFFSEHIKEGIEIKKVAEPEHGFKADKSWKLYI